ncbi:MAG TPA: heterodisulfide reductase-related iron-sulfur binding cluster, partial [Gemmatimonadales bacterium]|nr:heterodisulfide reductase-related iron-sulfur binding cluster [Gemmatimonadales bacterium]
SALDPCVHCGFCLPACPTYLVTGDEGHSPRGRIVLMRALERGEMSSGDAALLDHLDACLGCRGCEPACPSGVGYGRGLEAAREQLFAQRGLSSLARAVLGVFRYRGLWRGLFTLARLFRATRLPGALAGSGRVRFGMGMLASSAELRERMEWTRSEKSEKSERPERSEKSERAQTPASSPTVALFRGCVMDTLFRHVHDATRRTLEANGYQVVEVPDQVCCGALHEHAGDRAAARALAQTNVQALAGTADFIVVNSAGCGALLKDYGHLLGSPEAVTVAAAVRDVSELLAERGPRPGAPLHVEVAYDAPCHLQHAQRVHEAPLALLQAIPALRIQLLPGSDRCCGSAGIYSVLRPQMARQVLESKIAAVQAADPVPELIVTGNPGCIMQIGAGLRAAALPTRVAHPVELLDLSYSAAGFYG